jgi:hypothetical protein
MSDKWRYALTCWFYQKHSFYFLEDAIMILLDCTNKCKTTKLYYESIHMLSCAYNLAVIYNLKKKLSKEIAKQAFSLINDIKDTEKSRWILEPAEILINLDILNHYSSSYLISMLHREAPKFIPRVKDSSLEQRFLVLSKDLCRFLKLNTDEKIKVENFIQSQVARAWEESGNRRCAMGNTMGGIFDYKKSVEEYGKIGYSDRQKELASKIRGSYNNLEWNVHELS